MVTSWSTTSCACTRLSAAGVTTSRAHTVSHRWHDADGHWVALSTHRAWHLDCALCLLVQLSVGDGEHRDPLLLLWRMQLPTFGLGRGVKRLPEHRVTLMCHIVHPLHSVQKL